jgi:RNA polymerase sigma-70 factor (ECF subfamily)
VQTLPVPQPATDPGGQQEQLVDRARGGDADAWAGLYRAHAGRLEAWLAHVALREAGSGPEDLAAATWLTAAERIGTFRGGDEEFPGWLFGIARNHARNAARAVQRRPAGPLDDTVVDLVPLPAAEALVVADAWVREALLTLPEREREVIACLDVVGLDATTTAAALGISAVAVRVARHRGLRRLRRTLA